MEPLGLPRGTVRAAITILLILILALTLFVPVVEGAQSARVGLLALTIMAVKDYFGTRAAQNVDDGPTLPPPATN